MKVGTAALLACVVGGAAGLSGCVSEPATIAGVVGPAGPVLSRGPTGKLVVYSATTAYTSEQSRYALHTSYTLYDAKGAQLQKVENRTGLFAADPITLTLAAGQYRVRALATSAGSVIVPVLVAPGRTTTVYLDDTPVPQDLRTSANEVKLPDGHIVGWRAQ